jgi:glycosyltransferase involved in cell wall biosynthesis
MKKISIIIPTYNEEKTIEDVLNKVRQVSTLGFEKEIIVIDDGSTDKTEAIVRRFSDINFLKHDKNRGKGAAIRTSIDKASGDLLIIQDADLEYNPGNYKDLISAYQEGNRVVYGSRNMNPKRKGYVHYVWGVKFLSKIVSLISGQGITDAYTCYKLFGKGILESLSLKSDGFEIEAEITMKILKKGYKIKEIPIDYFPRTFKEGKKINVKDGIVGLYSIFKFWFK